MLTSNVPLRGGNLPTKHWKFNGFDRGVNTFALATELLNNELESAINCELYGKRSIRPRRGSETLGSSLGSSPIDGLFQWKEGSDNWLLALSGGNLKKYDPSTDSWTDISGENFTSGLRTRGVKLRGNLYFGNGTDDFQRFNGSIVESFTAVAAPTNLTVTPQGTTGTTEYEYTVTTVTGKGESLPASNVSISNGNETLDSSNFNRITFDRRTDSQVIGYNLYGRKKTGLGVTLMTFIDQPTSGSTITFDDDGTIEPGIWLPPEGDSTDGPKLKFWEQLRGSLVGAGDTNNPHRLYYSGTGDRYESFSPSHNGGWVDCRPGDNDSGINGLAPFEQYIIVAKQNSIHKFYFSSTTGDAVLQEVITYVGCGAPGSMVVMENDLAFIDSERRLRILGYEPNYTAGIRTTALSEGRVQSLFNEIEPDYMDNLEAVYFNGRYILAATAYNETTNSFVLVYDRRYLAFLGKWTGQDCHVRCWAIYDGVDGQKRLYAGSADDGHVYEFGTGQPQYNGDAVEVTLKTRNEDLGNSSQLKVFEWADLRIFQAQGTIKIKTILDGAVTVDERSFSSQTSTGWGIKKWGTTKWGVQTGTPATSSNLDKIWRKEIYEQGHSLQFEISKDGANDDFTLVSVQGRALLLPEEVFDTNNVI